ncbi:hypothetical protein INS49_014085 [Diaporthe citri]|uniref:uncharacterized protein n=1 Tax=Diaporthe citri TaxID=83186 RepID=UPI001C8028C9|nr:uncharacterized protein INS49_014085 [Diaporthe citri]KAG6358201.1 hypothetical protein INS49_014085 [Diaporthe citri]
MSATRRPYFIIVGLPADDKSMQDLDVEQLFHMKPEEVLILASLSLGYRPILNKLDQAEHVDGIIFGYGIRSHPSPSIAIFLEEMIQKVRYHPKIVKILFNWSIPSSLDACQGAMKLKSETDKEAVGSAESRNGRKEKLLIGSERL